jgi:osmotically-inducible protein OsmY
MRRTSLVCAVAAMAMMGAFAGCASSGTSESTGEYVDDAAITTKVKAAIFGDSGLKSLQISVETYKDVVQLSGFVDTPQARTHAGEIAAGVPGVRSVRNELVVK